MSGSQSPGAAAPLDDACVKASRTVNGTVDGSLVVEFGDKTSGADRSAERAEKVMQQPIEVAPPNLAKHGIFMEAKLGEGSFGQCFKSNNSNGIPKDILLEISALKELSHPNIIQLIDVISDGDTFYAKLEYVDYTLKMILKCEDDKFKDVNLYRSILRQIFKGVEYIHSNSYVHRDLKPINILVKSNGVIKIADFGGSRRTTLPSFSYVQRVGTTSYM
ncbi:hypothetical protein ACOME3_010120 [Neoechinorhynchus agilis]